MKERLYSEKETGALIQKAFELQQKEDAEGGYGLTEQELRKLAAEMGIRPQFLEDALQIQNTKEPTKTFHVWGAPLRVTQEKVIEGIVSEELWEEMVHKLRFAYKNQGRVERVGNTRDWIYATKDDEIVALSITTKKWQNSLAIARRTLWATIRACVQYHFFPHLDGNCGRCGLGCRIFRLVIRFCDPPRRVLCATICCATKPPEADKRRNTDERI